MDKLTFVKVQIQFEGHHKYPGAPEEVEHLRNLHRHTFIQTVQVEVSHNNREVEFFMLRDRLDSLYRGSWDGDGKSCEDLNDYTYGFLCDTYGTKRKYVVETSEDGMRSAISYYNFKEFNYATLYSDSR